MAPEIKDLADPILHLDSNQGFYINKTVIEGPKLCGAVSYSSWNGLHCWVVKLMLFIFRSIDSNHLWNLIRTSIPYYCFSPSWRGGAFSSPSLACPQLVHIYENVLGKETPMSLWNVATPPPPKILFYKFYLLKILQYLCPYLFIYKFCNISAYNTGL